MRRVRQISIAKYITAGTAVLILVMTIIMLVFINILANAAIEYDIKSNMTREARKNAKNLVYEDDAVKATDDFIYEEEGMNFLVLSDFGKVLIGDYPEGFEENLPPKNGEIRLVVNDGEEYYVLDRTSILMTKKSGQSIIIRSIVKKKDISSEYQTIKYLSYISIPVIVLCVLVSGFVMARRISIPIRQICKTAESIGRDEDLSQRIEYGGRFREIEVLSQANNRMLERLENMFESQKQFTSDVAHELRTPIAVVIAQCEYSKEHMNEKADFEEAMDVIYRQAQKTNDIIMQLLNLTRLDQDRVALELEYVDLKEIVQSVCEEEQLKAGKDIQFQLSLTESNAYMDIALMTILIQNLIHNAVKYSPQDSAVEIKTEKKDGMLLLSVKDYGCGIVREDLKNIFSRFYRVEKSRNSEGFGLGLPLAEKIAQIHGGKILVTSEVGQGSTFTLVLPDVRKD